MTRQIRFSRAQRWVNSVRPAAPDDPRTVVTRVFVRFQRSLLRYLRDLLARREDAEDVAQETYVRLVRAGSLEQSELHIRAFMFRAATNLAYDRFRQRRARGPARRRRARGVARRDAAGRAHRRDGAGRRDRRAHVARVAGALPAGVPAADVARAELRGDRGAARRQQAHRRARDASRARRVPTRVTRRRAAMTAKDATTRARPARRARRFVRVDAGERGADADARELARRSSPRTSAPSSASSSPSRSARRLAADPAARCTPRPRRPRARAAPAPWRAFAWGGALAAALLVAVFVVRDGEAAATRPRPSCCEAARVVTFDAPSNPSPCCRAAPSSTRAPWPCCRSPRTGDATLAEGLERDVVAALRTVPGLYVIADAAVSSYAYTDLSSLRDRRAARCARHRRCRRRARRWPRACERAPPRRRDGRDGVAHRRRQARRRATRRSLRDRRGRRRDHARLELARAGRARGPLERPCLRKQTFQQ